MQPDVNVQRAMQHEKKIRSIFKLQWRAAQDGARACYKKGNSFVRWMS